MNRSRALLVATLLTLSGCATFRNCDTHVYPSAVSPWFDGYARECAPHA